MDARVLTVWATGLDFSRGGLTERAGERLLVFDRDSRELTVDRGVVADEFLAIGIR